MTHLKQFAIWLRAASVIGHPAAPMLICRRRRRFALHAGWPSLVTVLLLLTPPAMADQAGSLYNKGVDMEARQDYEAAFNYYQQAFQLKPKSLEYRSATTRMRMLAAAEHVHRGQRLRDEGHLEAALVEFQTAALIDPSTFIAQQEIRRTRTMLETAKKAVSPGPSGTPDSSRLAQPMDTVTGPAQLKPLSGALMALKMSEDAKSIYTSLGKLAGINIIFDPDFKSHRITVDLAGVTLAEALQVVEMESKSFVRPVTANTLFVSSDTAAKRKDVEQSVMRTFYLSNLTEPNDIQEIANTVRTTLDLTRITPLPSQGAIVVRGTPDQLELAQKLIEDMDMARPEVTVDIAIMQVNRERIRDLGIQPPTSVTATLQGVSPVTVSNNGTSGATSTSGSGFTLNDLGNLNANNFAITIPQATATALLSDSRSKLLQNPQIRALDGQRATLKIGQRVPVATGSFSAGTATTGISPLVNTQFQYLDVGVSVDITPRVHSNNDITLKVSLDISAVDSTVDIGGIVQPVIGQRKIEHEIRLKEGEANVIGGMLEDADSKSLSGLPFLSSIPFLRYFFSTEHTDKRQNELVFVLVPHIVRGHELSPMNQKLLDIGTANVIELRREQSNLPKPVPVTPPEPPPAVPHAAPSARPPSGPAASGPAASMEPLAGPIGASAQSAVATFSFWGGSP
jgi:general secretion pathway protein D